MSNTNDTPDGSYADDGKLASPPPKTPPKPDTITIPAHTRHMADGSTQEVKAYTKPSPKGVQQKPRAGAYDPISHRRVKFTETARKRGPYKVKAKAKPKKTGPNRPRFTSPTHAAYIRERMAVPLAFLVTIKHSTQSQDADVQTLLYECISIVKMAQLFIGRFTSNEPMEE